MAINPLQLPQNFQPLTFDFSPLGKLGKVYKDAYDEAEAPGLIAGALGSQQRPAAPTSLSAIGEKFQPAPQPQAAASAEVPADKAAFIAKYSPIAEEASKRTGVDARLILAQAGLETGWGKSMPGGNLFGIKGPGTMQPTTEVVNGQPVRTADSFRAYASPEESGADYADFINKNPRYAGVRNAQGLDAQADALGRSGYATDPQYGSKVGSIARTLPGGGSADNQPSELDTAQWPAGPVGAPTSDTTDISAQSRGQPRAQPVPGGGAGVSREQLLALASNPNTRALAFQLIQRQMDPGKYGFQAVGDQLVRTNDRTGAAEVIPGIQGKPNIELKELNGRLIAYDKNTRQTSDVTPSNLPAGFRPATPEERTAYGVTADKPLFFGPDGKPATLNSGTTVNVDQKGQGAFAKEGGEAIAKRFAKLSEEGDTATTDLALVGQLRDLGQVVQTGAPAAVQGWLAERGIKVGPNVGAVEAYGAIIDKLTPQQRIPGSGATSDYEGRMFKNSLPTLMKTPDGNEIISNTLAGLAQHKIERARIAEQGLTGELTPQETLRKLRDLPSPYANFQKFAKDGGFKADPNAPGSATSKAPAAKLSPADASQSLSAAKAAIAGGAPRDAVIKRLQDAGIDPSGL